MADQLNFPKDRTELNPPGTGDLRTGDTYSEGGTVWVYDADVGAWGSGTGAALTDLYLSKVNDDEAAGAITFKALTTHEDGASVTGGSLNSAIVSHTSGPTYYPGTSSVFNFQDATGSSTVQSRARLDGTKSALTDASKKDYFSFISQPTLLESSTITKFTGFQSTLLNPVDNVDFTGVTNGFVAGLSLSSKTLGDAYGFVSDLTSASGRNVFNFYSSGDNIAPNFFQGSTYVGGNTTRNTFELWKSTLTEEQLEQLEAGTLAAPANVTTPGDGEFARQWWYNQQSAEDQALIDSGELEYPEHLAAATFTDTFALGNNTNINLNSNGLGVFGAGIDIRASHWNIDNVANGFVVKTGADRGGVWVKANNTPTAIFSTNGFRVDASSISTKDSSNNSYTFLSEGTFDDSTANFSAYTTYCTVENVLKDFIGYTANVNPASTFGGAERSIGFQALDNIANRAEFNVGFFGVLGAGAEDNYNFYAEGDAPNYFNGFVGIGTNDPSKKLHVWAGANSGILLEDSSGSGASPDIQIIGKRSDGNGNPGFAGKLCLVGNRTDAAVNNTKSVGTILFGGNHTDGNASNILYSASIGAKAEGTFSNSSTMPTALVFYTGTTGNVSTVNNSTFGTERMRITNAGDVGIGTTDPKEKLHVRGGDIVVGQSSGGNTGIRNYVKFGRDGAPKAAIGFLNHAANGMGSIVFMNSSTSDGAAFTDADERMRIERTGNVTISGNLLCSGVKFDNAVGTDTLDTYEEGTFTARFQTEPSINYTNQYGHYTIVGNVCTATYFLSWDAMNISDSNSLRLVLPVKAAFSTSNYRSGTGLGYIRGVDFTNQLIMTLSGGTDAASIWDLNQTGNGVSAIRHNNCQTQGEIQTTISYHIS